LTPVSGKDLIIPCPACDAANSLADGQDAKGARCNTYASPLFTGHPIHLTAERFNAHALAKGLPLVINFWASWCGPCQTMAPIFEALAAEFEPMVRFYKVNTDAEKELAHYFRIQSIPTLSFIRNQREAARVAGVLYPGDLRRWLYGALSEPEDRQAAP
jgi:thioredoxin 2